MDVHVLSSSHPFNSSLGAVSEVLKLCDGGGCTDTSSFLSSLSPSGDFLDYAVCRVFCQWPQEPNRGQQELKSMYRIPKECFREKHLSHLKNEYSLPSCWALADGPCSSAAEHRQYLLSSLLLRHCYSRLSFYGSIYAIGSQAKCIGVFFKPHLALLGIS